MKAALPALALRRQQTLTLLTSRTAWHPTLQSQFAHFGAPPGELPTERERCRPCHSNGYVNGRQGLEVCVNCQGRGWYLVDSYTRARAPEPKKGLSAAERTIWRRKIDAAIADARSFLHRPPEVRTAADVADVPPFAWERERDRHYRAGDYRALEHALAASPGNDAHLVMWTYEYDILPPSRHADDALWRLVDRMPTEIRVPHWLSPNEGGARRIREKSVHPTG